MPQVSAETKQMVPPRWAAYLRACGVHDATSIRQLAAAYLALTPTRANRPHASTSSDRRQDGLVEAWLSEKRVVQPDSAFRAGEALRTRMLVAGASGPIALYAAGYIDEFVGFVGTLERKVRQPLLETYFSAAGELLAVDDGAGMASTLSPGFISRALAATKSTAIDHLSRLDHDFGSTYSGVWQAWDKRRSVRGFTDVSALVYPIAAARSLLLQRRQQAISFLIISSEDNT